MMSADLQRKTATLSLTLQQLNIVRELLQINLPNHQVWAFGSRVAGHARKYPDLDLAVSHAEAFFFQQLCQLSTAFKNSDLDIALISSVGATLTPHFARALNSAACCICGKSAAGKEGWPERRA